MDVEDEDLKRIIKNQENNDSSDLEKQKERQAIAFLH